MLDDLKGFWWFERGRVAGMARPGFNACAWSDLGFEEGLLFSFFGKQRSGRATWAQLVDYLDSFGRVMAPYFAIGESERARRLERLCQPEVLDAQLASMQHKAQILDEVRLVDGEDGPFLEHLPNLARVAAELALVRQAGFSLIVSLLEEGLEYGVAHDGLRCHRVPIEDAHAPTLDQVREVAELLGSAEQAGERVMVHCLAGIGRTTTILCAAAVLRGAPLDATMERVRRARPQYQLRGLQAEFLAQLGEPNQIT